MSLDLGRSAAADLPTVLIVGEIYVRCDPFATDRFAEKLQARGIKVRLAPMTEWMEYAGWLSREALGDRISRTIQVRIQEVAWKIMARRLGWGPRPSVPQVVAAGEPWIRGALEGEAVLTLGSAIHEWRTGHLDGVLNVGPHECMPTKLAESQFLHVAEREGMLSMTVSCNGDPIDSEIVDRFAYEVKARHRRRRAHARNGAAHARNGTVPGRNGAGTSHPTARPARESAVGPLVKS